MRWESRGGRSQEEKPTNGPGVPTRHSGRRERRFQKGRCSREGSAAEGRRHFGFFFFFLRAQEKGQAARNGEWATRPQAARSVLCSRTGCEGRSLHFSSVSKTGVSWIFFGRREVGEIT